jgi:hypothetical protein
MKSLLLLETTAQPETFSVADVLIVRWPEEAAGMQRLRTLGRPRPLIVAPSAPAPATVDCEEEGSAFGRRMSTSELASRPRRSGGAPRIDPQDQSDGRLMFRGQSVNVSGIEEALARVVLEHFGELVDDRAMETAASASRPTTSNELHVNLSRLRKRLAPLGLVIRRVRRRGYVMEAVQ